MNQQNTIEDSKPSQSGKVGVLIAGGFSYNTLDLVQSCLKEGVNICGIIAHRSNVRLAGEKLTVPIWYYDQLIESIKEFRSTNVHDQYEACLHSILKDPRTAYFSDRYFGKNLDYSVFNYTVQIEMACWNSLAILKETSPARLVYMGVTHKLTTWVFGRCAEHLGMPTYFSTFSPLPWRFWAVKGIDEQQVIKLCPTGEVGGHSGNLSDKAIKFVEKNTQNYEVGMPEDQKKVLRNSIWSWTREIQPMMTWRPAKLVLNTKRLCTKYDLFKTYNKLSKPVSLADRYIVFFLHYQPEATTLPLGNGYVQQWLAIRTLAAALPAGCKLVVKEHPATFVFKEYTRHKSFYEAIAGLPQVTLASIEADPFALIDSSMAVVTITGTAGFQAICRGRPVLVFGTAAYRDCPGVFAVDNFEQVLNALEIIMSGKANPTREKLHEYLKWVERYSEGLSSVDTDDPYDADAQIDAQLKVWERLIRVEIEPPVIPLEKRKFDSLMEPTSITLTMPSQAIGEVGGVSV